MTAIRVQKISNRLHYRELYNWKILFMQYCGLALVSSFQSWVAFDFGTEIEIDSIIYSFIIICHNKICFNMIHIFRTPIFAKGRLNLVIVSSFGPSTFDWTTSREKSSHFQLTVQFRYRPLSTRAPHASVCH